MTESQLNILTKSKEVVLEGSNNEESKLRVELFPFKWKNFKKVIEIVKRYWDCYQKVMDDYKQQVEKIIEQTKDDTDKQRRIDLLTKLKLTYEEVPKIIENIFNSSSETVVDDVQSLIQFCLKDELDFDNLHIGEITCLFTAVIQVNTDFFTQNMPKMGVDLKIVDQEEEAETGEKPLVAS